MITSAVSPQIDVADRIDHPPLADALDSLAQRIRDYGGEVSLLRSVSLTSAWNVGMTP